LAMSQNAWSRTCGGSLVLAAKFFCNITPYNRKTAVTRFSGFTQLIWKDLVFAL
jgi:hypothetical protein